MSSQPLSIAAIVSLRGYRARVLYRRYCQLPLELRSPARTRLVLQAIMDYAYEPVPEQLLDPDEEALICRRLQEFLPHDDDAWPGGVMAWLHENQLPGAIRQRERMAGFLGDCLRWG